MQKKKLKFYITLFLQTFKISAFTLEAVMSLYP